MYLNTEKRSRNLRYIVLVFVLLFIFDIFLSISEGQPLRSHYLIISAFIFLAAKGPFILEYDRAGETVYIRNTSAIFGWLPIGRKQVKFKSNDLVGFRVQESWIRPTVWVQFKDMDGQILDKTFSLWSLSKPERKDIKASLGRLLTTNRKSEKAFATS
jgi:hypothetical protein